tara:strand:+ start:2330 stop:3940 length:1611 start_codon:yes stop_codon:yes gene_type:complete
MEFQEKNNNSKQVGTLAIDLGNSNTVIAFQQDKDSFIQLMDIPNISSGPGQIPSIVRVDEEQSPEVIIGKQAELRESDKNKSYKYCASDFKRWIGSKNIPNREDITIEPKEAGRILIHQIWKNLEERISINRLVLTAPVDTYKEYREWLLEISNNLPVDEVALVDEPTAAALGCGVPPGSNLLVIDIGGSTTDISLVSLEGGEGKAAPIAQLIKFEGKDVGTNTKQKLRCAKVLGKAGLRIGGRDIDKWIVKHFLPDSLISEENLNLAEEIKCKLSKAELSDNKFLNLELNLNNLEINNQRKFIINRKLLEDILIQSNFLNSLEELIETTLASGRGLNCSLNDINCAIIVGGSTRIPIIRDWIRKKLNPINILTPAPIEAVAKGALSLTPRVSIKDLLQRDILLRIWNKKFQRHDWHPLFFVGQTWPTENPLEIILQSSTTNQQEIEIIIGESDSKSKFEVIYKDGIPALAEKESKKGIKPWANTLKIIKLDPPAQIGQDCIKLLFSINENCKLKMTIFDLRKNKELEQMMIGSAR